MAKVETAFNVDGGRTYYTELDPSAIPSAGDSVRLMGKDKCLPDGWFYVHAVDRVYDMDTGELDDVFVGLRTSGQKD